MAVSAGKVMSVPPPARAFSAPAARPAQPRVASSLPLITARVYAGGGPLQALQVRDQVRALLRAERGGRAVLVAGIVQQHVHERGAAAVVQVGLGGPHAA